MATESTKPSAMVVLKSANDKRCAKHFDATGDELIVTSYDKEVRWDAVVTSVNSVDKMLAVLRTLSSKRNCIVTMGALRDEEVTKNIYRRKEGDGASMTTATRTWFPIDVDGFSGTLDELYESLPAHLQGVSHVRQYSSSHGVKDGLRLRLWYLTDEPVHTEVLRAYLASLKVADPSVAVAVQPIYIANPTFDGMDDPVQVRLEKVEGRENVTVADMGLDNIGAAEEGTIAQRTVQPIPAQIERAIHDILQQETVGTRHHHALGAACELWVLGAEEDDIIRTCEELIQKQGRDPEPGELDGLLRQAQRKAASGTITCQRVPWGELLQEVEDEEEEPVFSDAPGADVFGEPTNIAEVPADTLDAVDGSFAEAPDDDELFSEDEEDSVGIGNYSNEATDAYNGNIFAARQFPSGGYVRWGQADWLWNGKCWEEQESDETLWFRLVRDAGDRLEMTKLRNTVQHFRAMGARSNLTMPCMLTNDGTRTGYELKDHRMVFTNGQVQLDDALLDPADAITPHDPQYFSTAVIPHKYDHKAKCPRWMQALKEWFPEDEETVGELQKLFGYCLTRDTQHEHVFVLNGPSGTGKGVVTTVLQEVLGRSVVASMSLDALGTQFGLEPVVGKHVVLVPEANGVANQTAIDRIKAISGNDWVSVEGKRKAITSVPIKTKIVLSCNELPKMRDESGALFKRIRMFRFTQVYRSTKREDTGLKQHLVNNEMSGIINWAIDGLRKLKYDDGKFKQPQASENMMSEFRSSSAPLAKFIEEALVATLPSESKIPTSELYESYMKWCNDIEGITHPLSRSKLIASVMSALPAVSRGRQRMQQGANPVAVLYGTHLSEFGKNLITHFEPQEPL